MVVKTVSVSKKVSVHKRVKNTVTVHVLALKNHVYR